MRFRVTGLSGASLALIAGDLLVFLYFAAQGLATHSLPTGDSPVLTALAIAAPYAASWLIVAALLGVYRRATLDRPARLLLRTALAWLVAGAVGLIVRSLIVQRVPPPPFVAAVLGLVGALLLGWHAAYAVIAWQMKRRRER